MEEPRWQKRGQRSWWPNGWRSKWARTDPKPMTRNKPTSFVAVRSGFFRTCLSISRRWWGSCLWKGTCPCGVWSAPGDRRSGASGSSKGTRTTARGREERLSIWVTMMLSPVPGYRGTGRRVVALARMNPIDFCCCCLYLAPPPSSKSILQILHGIPHTSLMLNFLIVILQTTISSQSVHLVCVMVNILIVILQQLLSKCGRYVGLNWTLSTLHTLL